MIRHFFTSEYLFAPSFHGIASISDKIYSILAVIIFLSSFVLTYMIKKSKNPIQKDYFRKARVMTLTIGIFAVIWVFLRYEGIAILSAHWIIWVIYAVYIIWKANLFRYWQGEYREKMEAYEKEQLKKKYM